MMFRKIGIHCCGYVLLVAFVTSAAFAQTPSYRGKGKLPESHENTFWQALTQGKPTLNLRLRYEYAQQTGRISSNAGTIRTRLGYKTKAFKGFSALLSLSNNTVFVDDFNSGGGRGPNRTNYVVVADPRDTLVDRAYITYATPYHADVHAGRQVIVLDNQRFIGHVGFRQTWQTFDAVALDVKTLKDVRAHYAYIGQVNRVFGPNARSPLDRNRTNLHAFNINYHGFEFGDIVAYVYLDDNRTIPVFSNNSYGLRFTGSTPLLDEKMKLLYTLEYSYQTDATNNPIKYSANYVHTMLGIHYDKWLTAKIDWEQLGGNQDTAGKFFRFPQGTNHGFQGWADLFLVTPQAGINDYYLTLKFDIPTIPNWLLSECITTSQPNQAVQATEMKLMPVLFIISINILHCMLNTPISFQEIAVFLETHKDFGFFRL